MLPPVQLLRAGGDYWVVDGHNRVALAREGGQLWIDADVTELDLSPDNAAAISAKEN
jgi:ParB-like chromosome segregation protein Spo0J